MPWSQGRRTSRWWELIFFKEFSSLCGEMIQFDKYFSNGLKPPTSYYIENIKKTKSSDTWYWLERHFWCHTRIQRLGDGKFFPSPFEFLFGFFRFDCWKDRDIQTSLQMGTIRPPSNQYLKQKAVQSETRFPSPLLTILLAPKNPTKTWLVHLLPSFPAFQSVVIWESRMCCLQQQIMPARKL